MSCGLEETHVEDEVIKYRDELTNYIKSLQERTNESKLEWFADFRKMKLDTIKEAGIFYIGEQAEMLVPEYFDRIRDFGVISNTNNKPIFHERYVIPLHDISGRVMGMVGYKYGADDKYLYANMKYFERGNAIYGLENMKDILDKGCAIVVEGIMDAIRVKELGFSNVIATCGADKSWDRMLWFMGIKKCIFIPDRDRAGKLTKEHWISDTQLRVYLPEPFKDMDEFARQNDITKDFSVEFLGECIEYIKNEMVSGDSKNISVSDLVGI